MESWEAATRKFLEPWKKKGAVGALVCGSYVTGMPDSHSDVDLHIILEEGTGWRERGNLVVDGFLIEYFANPPESVERYFEEDHAGNRLSSQTMFLTGRIIFDDGAIASLKRKAAGYAKKGFPKMPVAQVELSKYAIWDALDNLEQIYERDGVEFPFSFHNALGDLFSVYSKFLRTEVSHPHKQYCRLNDSFSRRKYLQEAFPDHVFASLYSHAIAAKSSPEMMSLYRKLSAHALRRMGGFDIDGWRLRTPAQK